MFMKTASTLAFAFVLSLLTSGIASVSAMNGLETSEVQLRATAPGMTATGGYLTIHNHMDKADRLVGVSADFAAKAEIHTMANENGVMKMRPLPDGIEIPAGGMVELAPGGMHLMLMGLKQTLEAGQMLEVELTFASGRTLRLPAHVKRPGDIGGGDMSGGHGHSHNHSHNHSHSQSGS
ncbi:MAG: copper chaperone PCu(A)C [Candidatus Puniceispirillaceae bacterium]|jgi:copper(I)-binding protein